MRNNLLVSPVASPGGLGEGHDRAPPWVPAIVLVRPVRVAAGLIRVNPLVSTIGYLTSCGKP